MLDGWKRAAVLALVVLGLAIYTLVRPVPQRAEVDRLEEQLAAARIEGFAGAPPPTADYVRYYAFVRAGGEDELPFNRLAEGLTLPPDKRLIAGILVEPRLAGRGIRPGVRRVARRDMPSLEGHGCAVVNLLYDPRAEEVLAAWCNGGRIEADPGSTAPVRP